MVFKPNYFHRFLHLVNIVYALVNIVLEIMFLLLYNKKEEKASTFCQNRRFYLV